MAFSLLFPFAVTMDHNDGDFAGLLVSFVSAGALLDEAVTGSQDMEPFAYIEVEIPIASIEYVSKTNLIW